MHHDKCMNEKPQNTKWREKTITNTTLENDTIDNVGELITVAWLHYLNTGSAAYSVRGVVIYAAVFW